MEREMFPGTMFMCHECSRTMCHNVRVPEQSDVVRYCQRVLTIDSFGNNSKRHRSRIKATDVGHDTKVI